MKVIAPLALCVALAGGFVWASGQGQSAAAADMRVIVERMGDSVEVFVNFGAGETRDIFAIDGSALAASDGRVYFGALRSTGTFDFGDAMLAQTRFAADGVVTGFEAMSVMVHPADATVAFEQPIDGAIAMSVCGVPDPEVPPTLEELQLFAGFIAYPLEDAADLSWTLANEAPLTVDVREYSQGVLTEQRVETVLANGTIDFVADQVGWWQSSLARIGLL